jgi:hypothetical protein
MLPAGCGSSPYYCPITAARVIIVAVPSLMDAIQVLLPTYPEPGQLTAAIQEVVVGVYSPY